MQLVDSYIADIANPGFGPLLAVHAKGDDGLTYVFTHPGVLAREMGQAQRFLAKVRAAGQFDPDLWDRGMTDAEREAHFGAGGDLWQWEEQEKAAGRW
jgi:hypothetical protein